MSSSNQNYSQENLDAMFASFRTVAKRASQLTTSYIQHPFKTDRGKEYAIHGYCRRINLITRCIQNIFTVLPPETSKLEIPNREKVLDATINIQSALINTFGCIDNLAWVWVEEKGVKDKQGNQLERFRVGLTKNFKDVRRSFSPEFQTYIKTIDRWFTALGEYRDGLAHRISLYIPPCTVPTHLVEQYKDLEKQSYDALFSRGDVDEHERLKREAQKLERFIPMMQHSFGEGARPMPFHSQMLANFTTVEEIGKKLLVELQNIKQEAPIIVVPARSWTRWLQSLLNPFRRVLNQLRAE